MRIKKQNVFAQNTLRRKGVFRKNPLYLFFSIVMLSLFGSCSKPKEECEECDFRLLEETDSIQIYTRLVSISDNERDIGVWSLRLKNKFTGEDMEILKTAPEGIGCWYLADGKEFKEVSIDSIPAVSRVFIRREYPLKLIVEGCPDSRNEYTYIIDVPSRKAWWVPSNNGFRGGTEEGYLIFHSYRYVSDPERGGRYTFIQIFNEKGEMVDSLDLEHVVISESKNETK